MLCYFQGQHDPQQGFSETRNLSAAPFFYFASALLLIRNVLFAVQIHNIIVPPTVNCVIMHSPTYVYLHYLFHSLNNIIYI